MASDSDSDIEMLGPVSTGAGAARASVPARTSFKANATYQADRPPSSSSSNLALPPPLAARPPPFQNKTSSPHAGNVIEIDSDDDDDVDAGPAHVAKPSIAKNELSRQVASAPSDVLGKAKKRGKALIDDSQDEDEELPDIGGGSFRRTASDTSMLSHRLDKGKGRQTDKVPSPPSSSSSLGRCDVNTKTKQLFQPEPSTTKARAESSRQRKASESSDDDEPVKKRKKSTDKETEPVLTKTQLKEQERAAKKAEKDKEKAEKAAAAAKEKESKNAMKNSNKLSDRKESCREIEVRLSSALLADKFFKDKIQIALEARYNELDCKYVSVPPVEGCHPNTIHWVRDVTKDWDSKSRCWIPRARGANELEEQATIIIYLSAQEVEEAVQRRKDGQMEGSLIDLATKAQQAHAAHYQIFLLIQNLSEKGKAKQRAENASWAAEALEKDDGQAAKKRAANNKKWNNNITMDDIKDELAMCQIAGNCHIITPEGPGETVDWIVELTKGVAHKPYKLIERKREAALNIDGKIESSDRGNLAKTYLNQLACIFGITNSCAQTIASHFPTWRILINAYRACNSEYDRKELLADLVVASRTDGAAKNKRIGSALSERIYIFLFTKDKNLNVAGKMQDLRARQIRA